MIYSITIGCLSALLSINSSCKYEQEPLEREKCSQTKDSDDDGKLPVFEWLHVASCSM